MTDQKYPSREVVLNIIAAGGWEYVERSDGLCCLRTPKGLEYLLPRWRSEPPQASANSRKSPSFRVSRKRT